MKPTSAATSFEVAHCPKLQVLTYRVLWDNITSFLDGWPYLVLQFQQQCLQSVSTTVVTFDQLPELYIGLLPQMAIAEGDEKVLKALIQVRKRSPLARGNWMFALDGAMLRAVEFDRLDIIKWLFKEVSSDPAWEFEEGLMDMALARANVEMMDWLVHHYPKSSVHVSKRCMENQARLGNVAVFQWLCNRGCSIPKSVLYAAISDGHLNVVECLHENDTGAMWTAEAMDIAASSGHLEIVKFLHQHRHEGCTAGAIDNAASNGHDGVVAFLLLTYPELCSDDMLTEAARTGNAVLARALCALSNKGCLFDARKAATAAAEGVNRKLVVEILNSCISKRVRACSIDKHFRNGTRRCQRADQRRAMLPREHARLHGE